MPKIQLRSNSVAKYIYNQDIGDLLSIVNNTNTNDEKSFWVKFAEIGQRGGFNNKKVFEGLCQIMVQIADREQYKKRFQNLKYSDQFSDFLVILASLSPRAYNIFRQNFAGRTIQNIRLHYTYSLFTLHDPELCYENVVHVKRLVNTIKYTGPIIAMSDNTKLKERLGFSFLYGCIVGSTLSTESTRVSSYEDIYQIIDTIKSHNAIASQIPFSKFSPCVIAMIANKGKEIAANIFELYKKLLDMAAHLQLSILGFGADGICPIYPNVSPIIRITDSLHAKKNCCNALFSGAHLLSLGKYSACYDQILELRKNPQSILYKKDVENVNHQDDGAAY
ncbi:15901_t:CDS:2 [Cetraspora pellucida]|uniref:15901_t:CDS:1 n=1 Tax=Cetraspora pellucida TaxID=1433469 RepID=A0A9N9P3X4_9GLOM|nr:15901_t:CDS:2 [Cetraspora pellucida]